MIPLAKDTREAVGAFADKVENRSLLFEKMVLAKSWGHDARFDDANRFNVLRACTGGTALLAEDRDSARRSADRTRNDNVREKNAYKAKVAGALAGSVNLDSRAFLERRTQATNHFLATLEESYQGRVETFAGTLGGRLLINLAGGVMENAGMALDRCFGLPFIPGSACKGVARHQALWEIRREQDREKKESLLATALLVFGFIRMDLKNGGDFGWAAESQEAVEAALRVTRFDPSNTSELKGMCAFLPAHPCDPDNFKIVAECITPHPTATKASEGKENPHPLFMPAVDANSTFGFAIVLQRIVSHVNSDRQNELLTTARRWLIAAIQNQGLGAKTGSGYGWFSIDPAAEERRRAASDHQLRVAAESGKTDSVDLLVEEDPNLSPAEREKFRVAALAQSEFAALCGAIVDEDPQTQEAICFLLSSEMADQWKAWKKAKKWKNRIPDIREIAAKFDIELR